MNAPPERGTIELHLQNVDQLFDTLDPSPFRQRDLDPKAEEFIVESARELCSSRPREIALFVDQGANDPETRREVSDAILTHFARRSELARRELRRLLQRGGISFVIGMAFLSALFAIVQSTGLANAMSGPTLLVRESMIIIGWVAMWKPLEMLLYDWWPILGEQRLLARLSRITVRIV